MLIKKEFLQVFRSPLLLSILIVAPMVQFLLFPFTADYEIKTLQIAFIDHDHSSLTRDIMKKFEGAPSFVLHGTIESKQQAEKMIQIDELDFVIEFPAKMESQLLSQQKISIAITANAINSIKASIGTGYIQTILGDFLKTMGEGQANNSLHHSQLLTTNIYWFNEKMNYKNLMIPGILVILVTLIGAYVTALNIVREKEIGTIEQINVTPIKKWQFLLGKMIPFWILGMTEFMMGIGLMYLVFGISVQGSLPALMGITAIYLLVMLGLGFFISIVSENQLQAMFIVFFLFILFVLLSGLFTPTEGMPEWAKYINYFNPMSFYMDVIKKMILKGSSIHDVKENVIALASMAVILNTAALMMYRDSKK
jgi:ABC-2 type transport system permease protein